MLLVNLSALRRIKENIIFGVKNDQENSLTNNSI